MKIKKEFKMLDKFEQLRLRRIKKMEKKSTVSCMLSFIQNSERPVSIEDVTGINGSSETYARSLLSKFTSQDSCYVDEYGNAPVYKIEEKTLSSKSDRFLSLFVWNDKYGKSKYGN